LIFLAVCGTSPTPSKSIETPSIEAVDIAMGVGFLYQTIRPGDLNSTAGAIADFGVPYYIISISLNVILTLMIVVRLVVHNKNVRKILGGPFGTSGLYNTIITMLVESCALYAVSFVLFIGPWAADSPVSNAFFPILASTQVRSQSHRQNVFI
jgi:hypothetical protein